MYIERWEFIVHISSAEFEVHTEAPSPGVRIPPPRLLHYQGFQHENEAPEIGLRTPHLRLHYQELEDHTEVLLPGVRTPHPRLYYQGFEPHIQGSTTRNSNTKAKFQNQGFRGSTIRASNTIPHCSITRGFERHTRDSTTRSSNPIPKPQHQGFEIHPRGFIARSSNPTLKLQLQGLEHHPGTCIGNYCFFSLKGVILSYREHFVTYISLPTNTLTYFKNCIYQS